MSSVDPAPAAEAGALTLSISLVSHTNVGKTTLARTLLGRDVGEVRDAAHVTETAEPHLLLESPAGDRLLLWDTPGFGDSLRLAQRLAHAGNPLGWLLTEVWDRWRDRPFWASQRAIRHVLGACDVAIYLVNAAEPPEDSPWLGPELRVLGLLGKPVVAVLNQLGVPGAPAAEAAELARWQAHLDALSAEPGSARVQALLPLDAFSRCWVQEAVLLDAVARALPPERQPAMARLHAAWQARGLAVWQQSMQVLATRLARAAADLEPVQAGGWPQRLRQPLKRLGAALGLADGPAADDDGPEAQAMARLAARLDDDIRQGTARLIGLHGLAGSATGEVLQHLASHFARRTPVSEGKAALWGGAVAGALAGLKADIATGGLTLGGGLLAGGVLGALGAAGAARGVNRLRGLAQPVLAWSDGVLAELLRSALLAYLAVAHHGRGRGAWQQGDAPAAWAAAVDAELAATQPAWEALWRERQAWLREAGSVPPAGPAAPAASEAVDAGEPAEGPARALPAAWQAALAQQLQQAGAALLLRLCPQPAEQAGLAEVAGQGMRQTGRAA